MDNSGIAYDGSFTVEERKIMTAEMLKELRKVRKLSQKEIAAHLNVPATTYNTYESGRTEPPLEILVRLSFLYDTSLDVIVQRNRTYRTPRDLFKQMTECKDQIADLERELAESGKDASAISGLFDIMGKLADAMTLYSQTEAAQKGLKVSKDD